jgi:hypothetical protein
VSKVNERIKELMDKYVEATMKNLAPQLKSELELAFLTGVQAGMDEAMAISRGVRQQWETRDYHAEAH